MITSLKPKLSDAAPLSGISPAARQPAAAERGNCKDEALMDACGGKGRPVCCILGASFRTGNMGVNALASGTVAAILSSYPDARIFLLDYGKSPVTHRARHAGGFTEVDLVNIRFSWKVFLRNNVARLLVTALLLKLVPFQTVRARLAARNPWLKEIQEADIIVSLAGGDSFSDIYGLRRFLYVSLPQLLVIAMDKPLTLLPQTLGPFKTAIARRIAGFILRRAERVYARDRESMDEVRSLMGRHSSKLGFSYDMAFLLKPFAPVKQPDCLPCKSGSLVGLNVSGLLYSGGYTGRNMFGLKSDYRQLIQQIIEYFIGQGAEVVLVPHVFGGGVKMESDTAAAAEIYRELENKFCGRLHLITEENDEHEIKYLIGQCHFFLGSRMHACIAALSQGIPAIGLAYSKKFRGLFETIGVEDLAVDLRQFDGAEIMSRIENAYQSRTKIARGLGQKLPEVRKSVSAFFAGSATRNNGSLDHAKSDARLQNACPESDPALRGKGTTLPMF